MIAPLLLVKGGRIVELRSLVARSQCLSCRFSINSAEAFPGIVRLLIELPSELGKSFTQTPANFPTMSGSGENEDHSKYQDYFPSSNDVGEHWHQR